MKKLLAIIALVTLFGAVGCSPRMAGHLVGAAIVGAAVVGSAAVIAHHDAHFHHYNCGCPRDWNDGRYVYYYQGGWEYHDPDAGVWYRYDE